MRSVVARLERLERMHRTTAQHRLTIRFGHLKQLPTEYAGERHVVTVKQLPRNATGAEWYEFEERPGPDPVSKDHVPNDSKDHILTVFFVDSRDHRRVTKPTVRPNAK